MEANKIKLKNGLWNIYKPKGVTSFDMVRKIKWMTGEKKVGHAGTLDPLAEGVLVVGIGRESTKKLRFVLEEDKEYIAEIKLGMSSTTDDEEGVKTLSRKIQDTNNPPKADQSKTGKTQTNSKLQDTNLQTRDKRFKAGLLECSDSGVKSPAFRNADGKASEQIKNQIEGRGKASTWPSSEEIEKVIKTFIGDIIQISPVYSAIKIGGERAYKKARRGEKFTQPPRIVTIKEIEILDYQVKKFKGIKQKDNDTIPAGKYPVLKIKCIVGSGTYIRSLAREIGEKLKTDGYLTGLTRTSVGIYKIKDSIKL